MIVHTAGADHWGRVVAQIEYGDGLDLEEEMVRAGVGKRNEQFTVKKED